MELLPPDILRETALKLPLNDIFKLCRTSKKFQQYICNYKPFWEALFILIIGPIDISKDASIIWLKDKIKEQEIVATKLISLLENKKINVKYISNFDINWTKFELIKNLKELNCPHLELKILPIMINLTHLWCYNNILTSLPYLPKLEIINCDDNQLTIIPFLPNLKIMYCGRNNLIFIPSLPNLETLWCQGNGLTFIPPMPKLKELECGGNPLPFFTLKEWQVRWNKQ